MPETPIAPLPPLVRYLIGTLSVVTLVSALAMAITAAVFPKQPVWVLTGFEVVVLVAGVMGVLGLRGRFDEGQALHLACIAGVLFVGGFLSYLGTRQGIVFQEGKPPSSTFPWMLGRLGLAGVYGAIAAYAVLRRSAQARAFMVRAVIAGAALAVLAAPFVFSRGMPGWLSPTGKPVMYAALALYGLAALVGVCAFGHCLIRAFECGRAKSE
ncbi:hypothetical protein PHYC_00443 [Phycisphaerales bacterium]|nr:hypothetical protein PHYC_00443 [Phycisphaerales bacterium]